MNFYRIDASYPVVGRAKSKRTLTYYARGTSELARRMRYEFAHHVSYLKIREISEAQYVRATGRDY